jgi:hypothetical protein
MAIGFALNLTLASGKYDPDVLRSAAGNLTMASGGSAVTIPWVTNNMESTPPTSVANLKIAIQAGTAAILNSLAASGAPT